MVVTALSAALGQLVLERQPDGRFTRRGGLPAWCAALRSRALDGNAPIAVEEVFPFLDVFLPQAQDAWRSGGDPWAESEFWTEVGSDGQELHLEATAVRVGDDEVLVIERNERLFAQRRLVLQRARDQRMLYDKLTREIEQKDVLVHAIVHDLAAPLHGILGSLSLLGEMPIADPGAQWIRLALEAAMRQRQLIREILDVFSAEQGGLAPGLPAGPGPDLGAAMKLVMEELEPAALRRNVRLELRAPPSIGRVVAEETRLVRVLTNLLDNALRHAPAGTAVVLGARPEARTIVVSVEDQGPGVTPELLPQLFEKFARGRERAGTGLGLYFCRITVESWGGGIGYEARPGGGARFWVRLTAEGEPWRAS